MKKLISQVIPSLTKHGASYKILSSKKDAEIEGLEFDSRAVKKNSLFFALPGTHTTGNKFIAGAVKNGASAVIFQDELSQQEIDSYPDVVFVKVDSSRFAMSPVASSFYDNPSKKLVVYGVTGTEGKSSTVSFLWQLLRFSGYKAGFISTVEYSLGGDAVANPEHQTTPEATIVQRELYEMVCNGCTHAVVESSSHGLSGKLNRLGDVLFDCGIFMNVTLEHLEFHGTYEQYKDDKANLFRALDKHDHVKIIDGKETKVPCCGIVNLEDKAAPFFADCTKEKVYGFTTDEEKSKNNERAKIQTVKIENVNSTKDEINFSLGEVNVKANLPGAFNSYNVTAALLAVSHTTGISIAQLSSKTEKILPVKGRMTVINEGQDFELIVDYAHTPSSFETIFPPIRKRCSGKMICVFGSGGERDLTKRPLQGEIAAKYCDVVILADEDPRNEDPETLLRMIADGCFKAGKKEGENLFIICDRPKAIRKAFSLAGKNDIVLLLGKAHENSIIYKDRVMKYDEIAEAKAALSELK